MPSNIGRNGENSLAAAVELTAEQKTLASEFIKTVFTSI